MTMYRQSLVVSYPLPDVHTGATLVALIPPPRALHQEEMYTLH
jgi:hypothetical protein